MRHPHKHIMFYITVYIRSDREGGRGEREGGRGRERESEQPKRAWNKVEYSSANL